VLACSPPAFIVLVAGRTSGRTTYESPRRRTLSPAQRLVVIVGVF